MAGASREQALSLLAAAKNDGYLAVKISSFKQVKEILLSMEPSSSSDLFPYIAELHTSPESLVRKYLVELMEELGMKSMERSFILMPVLLTLLKDDNPDVVRQSIISGAISFCSVLREISLQFAILVRLRDGSKNFCSGWGSSRMLYVYLLWSLVS